MIRAVAEGVVHITTIKLLETTPSLRPVLGNVLETHHVSS